jgi:V/A-type H+-transporting ATPase subunit E
MSQTTRGIAELIGRLRKDGVDAGEEEKARIVEDAKGEAAKILEDARRQADELLAAAKRERDRLEQQLHAELQMAARDFVHRFDDRIRSQIIDPVVEDSLKAALDDAGFLSTAIAGVCRTFVESGGKGLQVTVSSDKKASLEAFFTGELEKALDGGKVEIVDESGLVGFRVNRKGESFVWDFTQESVAREVAHLVDPALRRFFELKEGDAAKKSAGNGRPAASA